MIGPASKSQGHDWTSGDSIYMIHSRSKVDGSAVVLLLSRTREDTKPVQETAETAKTPRKARSRKAAARYG